MTQNLQNKAERNSAIEMLRIVAMLLIVCSHASFHGEFPQQSSSILLNNIMLDWLVLGNVGVDLFIMITGYFFCKKTFHFSALNKLFVSVWFYSMLGLLVGVITGTNYSWMQIIRGVFPTVFKEYWFFTAYIVLLIFSPCLNGFLKHTTKIQLSRLIGMLAVIWAVIPTFTKQDFFGNEIPQFILLYLIGAYFQMYPNNVLKRPIYHKMLVAISVAMLFTSSVVLRAAGRWLTVLQGHENLFYARNSVLIVACAIGVFCWGIYANAFNNSAINIISGCTFGIYLFHDNTTMRRVLWGWFDNPRFYNSALLLPRILLSSCIVFMLGFILECVRKRWIEPMALKCLNKVESAMIRLPQKEMIMQAINGYYGRVDESKGKELE